jgi:hypothetical protein
MDYEKNYKRSPVPPVKTTYSFEILLSYLVDISCSLLFSTDSAFGAWAGG